MEAALDARRTASQEKVKVFLGRYPEYEKTLRLAIAHEESAESADGKGGNGMMSIPIRPSSFD